MGVFQRPFAFFADLWVLARNLTFEPLVSHRDAEIRDNA